MAFPKKPCPRISSMTKSQARKALWSSFLVENECERLRSMDFCLLVGQGDGDLLRRRDGLWLEGIEENI